MPQLPQQAADRASAVLAVHRANLMFQPGVIGVGLGRTDNEAAIVIYVNKEAGTQPALPADIEGIPETVNLTDPFVARQADWATKLWNSWPNCIFLFTIKGHLV